MDLQQQNKEGMLPVATLIWPKWRFWAASSMFVKVITNEFVTSVTTSLADIDLRRTYRAIDWLCCYWVEYLLYSVLQPILHPNTFYWLINTANQKSFLLIPQGAINKFNHNHRYLWHWYCIFIYKVYIYYILILRSNFVVWSCGTSLSTLVLDGVDNKVPQLNAQSLSP